MEPDNTRKGSFRKTGQIRRRMRGSILVEVSIAMGFAAFLGLFAMKASLLSITSNQWIIMQTLTDAQLTRETALSARIPFADLTGPVSLWPEQGAALPAEQMVMIGRLAGGTVVNARLSRFRVNATLPGEVDTGIVTWRLHSVLDYSVAGQRYVKSRSTLRSQ